MKIINICLITIIFSLTNKAISQDKGLIAPYQWKKRVLLLFSSEKSDLYQKQLDVFDAETTGMKERDLVTFYITSNGIDTSDGQKFNANASKKLRQDFQLEKDAFAVILIGKDGTQKLKQNEVLKADNLFGIIDTMPMRKREMREHKEN